MCCLFEIGCTIYLGVCFLSFGLFPVLNGMLAFKGKTGLKKRLGYVSKKWKLYFTGKKENMFFVIHPGP